MDRKNAFITLCNQELNKNETYNHWLNLKIDIFISDINYKNIRTKNVTKNNDNETFKIVKERSSGKNVMDVERTIITEKSNGTLRKTVVKDTIVKVTVRGKKRKEFNKENAENEEISRELKNKKAKTVRSVMNHLSEHDENTKASLMSKVIDDEGTKFAEKVIKNSKALQENSSMTAEQTTSLISGTRTSDLVFRQMRTAFNKTIGYSPIASHKKS